ncbi:MAG: hypothetical protein R2734_20470 [Nocardioides sp.]
MSYDGHTVHGTVRFRELRKRFRHHYVWVRDSHGGWENYLDIVTSKARPQRRQRRQGLPTAGASWHFNYATNVMTFALTDQCVPVSDWVRLDILTYMSRDDALAWLDAAYAKGAGAGTLGPRIHAS